MINILSIGLVLTSLLTAVLWSPSHPTLNEDQQYVIVKHGNRVVTVEYDQDSTKVSISPPDNIVRSRIDSKDSSNDNKLEEQMFSGTKDIVCDDQSNCKRKIAKTVDKTTEAVTKTANWVSDKAQGIEERVKDKISEKVSGHMTGESLSKAKKVAGDVIGTVKDGVSKTKHFDIIDSPKRIGEDIARNATRTTKEIVEETVKNVHEIGQKSLNDIVSKLKKVSYDVIGYVFYRDSIGSVVGLVHMVGFSTAYGMCVWVSFVSSYVLGRYLPGQMFGIVQSKIYPVYFKSMAYCVSAVLLAHLVGRKREVSMSKMEIFQNLCLVSALLMVLVNMKLLEPKATKAMYERMKIEKEEGRGVAVADQAGKDGMADGSDAVSAQDGKADGMAHGGGDPVVKSAASVVRERQNVWRLNEKLKRLNSYSSALNLSTLVVLTWHMAYMGQLLQAAR